MGELSILLVANSSTIASHCLWLINHGVAESFSTLEWHLLQARHAVLAQGGACKEKINDKKQRRVKHKGTGSMCPSLFSLPMYAKSEMDPGGIGPPLDKGLPTRFECKI